MNFVKIAFMLSLVVSSAIGRPVAEKLLSSSHVAVITVHEVGERYAFWEPITASVTENLKGDWAVVARFFVHVVEGSGGLRKGGKYLVFCSAVALPERGVSLCTRKEDIIPVDSEASKVVVDRIARTAAQQREALKKALQSTMMKSPHNGDVPEILALLFDERTQRDAVRRLLALPADADRALAMHVYDVRPIPRNMLSPDEPVVFHSSAVADCRCIQEVVVWILGLRLTQGFGQMSDAPTIDARMAVADAWFYWVMAEK